MHTSTEVSMMDRISIRLVFLQQVLSMNKEARSFPAQAGVCKDEVGVVHPYKTPLKDNLSYLVF